MIPLDNTSQISASTDFQTPQPSNSSDSLFSSPATNPFHHIFSPVQTILSFLNLTSLFQSVPLSGSSTPLPSITTSYSYTTPMVSPFLFHQAYNTTPQGEDSIVPDNRPSLDSSSQKDEKDMLERLFSDPDEFTSASTVGENNFSPILQNQNPKGLKLATDPHSIDREVNHTWLYNKMVNDSGAWTFSNDSGSFWGFDSTPEQYELSWNFSNVTNNATLHEEGTTLISVITAVVLAFVILLTVVGNVFVIAAILLERNLQSVANYLILSLAVTDLLVAALVMPLGAVYEVSKEWSFGPEVCDMWTVSDVLCCTASILHLVAIAIDRYWAVTNVDYIQQRSPKRVCSMIAVIWGVSTLISAAPLMGWKDSEWHGRVRQNKVCLVSQDIYYQVFATMTSFYLPLAVILFLYWRIYQAARKRIRRKVGARTQSALCRGTVTISETTTFTRVSSGHDSPEKSSNGALADVSEKRQTDEALRLKMAALPLNPLALLGARAPRRRELDARRERKAAKTLAVITGVFVMCWLPFFVMALLMPLCTRCYFSPYLVATLLWLGYFNSTLNPILYTVFSPDFRNAFRRILCGKKRVRKRQYDARVSSFKSARS